MSKLELVKVPWYNKNNLKWYFIDIYRFFMKPFYFINKIWEAYKEFGKLTNYLLKNHLDEIGEGNYKTGESCFDVTTRLLKRSENK